jgi:hypothetical protein
MERTPEGTPVGVDDPYEIAGICDHLTDDGRCRLALQHAGVDPDFAAERAADDYACHVGEDGEWPDCRHYRSTTSERACERCGLEEVRVAHDERRPLLEEHHLSYPDGDGNEPRDHDLVVSVVSRQKFTTRSPGSTTMSSRTPRQSPSGRHDGRPKTKN